MNPKERKRIDKEGLAKESLKVLEKNPYNVEAIENAIYYYTYIEHSDHQIKNLKLRSDALNGNINSMVECAKQCKSFGIIKEMIYFYDMAISHGDINDAKINTSNLNPKSIAICEMINYYLKIQNYVKAREYIVYDLKYSCKECINKFLSALFDISIAANYQPILNDANLSKLKKNLKFYDMVNNISLKIDADLNRTEFKEDCYICCENSYPIILPCDHKICLNCYPNISNRKCPYCRKVI